MPANSPLGISFSPFDPQNNGPSQTGYNPSAPPSPQEPIAIRSLRLPRTVGAQAPVAAPLLRAPGGPSFGAAGQNLEQLLALLFGPNRMFPGGSPTFNERPPQGDFGGGMFGAQGEVQPLPWMRQAPSVTPSLPPPRTTFNETERGGEPYSPPSAGSLPWERSGAVERGDRFRV
jgi:hypothetical protein